MTTQSPIPFDDPLMIAWNFYNQSPEFENTKRWAIDPNYTDGSLWAAFSAGYRARENRGEQMQDIKNRDMIDLMQTRNQAQLAHIDDTLRRLRQAKPKDQSPEDRAYAIVITEIEKARAYFKTYILDAENPDTLPTKAQG